MMWLILGAVAVVGLAAAYRYRTKRSGEGAVFRVIGGQPPANLGIPVGHPAHEAAQRLEASIDPSFEARLQSRVRERSRMTEVEWEWTWFELKRYFLMCGIMRQVQMYSRRADEIWHEMLVFTREYQAFCEQWCGTMIHHAPHGRADAPSSDDRAWFDWVYHELFEPTPVSERVWGGFFRSPMSRTMMEEPLFKSPNAYREARFNMRAADKRPEVAELVEWLAGRFSQQLLTTRRLLEKGQAYPKRSEWEAAGFAGASASGAMFFASLSAPNDYERQMSGVLEREKQAQHGSGSSCSGAYTSDDRGSDGGSSHSHDGGGSSNSGGSDGGGSSCSGGSSCGSGCGSS